MPTYSAQRIIKRALDTIGVVEAEETPTAAEQQDALDALNDILNEWDLKGIGGGFQDVTISTELTLDADEYRSLRLSLAVDLATSYQAEIGQAILMQKERAERVLEAKYANPSELCIDSALTYRNGGYNIVTDE